MKATLVVDGWAGADNLKKELCQRWMDAWMDGQTEGPTEKWLIETRDRVKSGKCVTKLRHVPS